MKSVLLIFLLLPLSITGQVFSKLSIRSNLVVLFPVENIATSYTSLTIPEYPIEKPTLLGNLNSGIGIELAAVYTGIPARYRPELIFRYYQCPMAENDFYKNLTINTISIGLGNTFILYHSTQIEFNAHLNFYLDLSQLRSDASNKLVQFEDSLTLNVAYAARKESFTGATIEAGGSIRYGMSDRTSIIAKASLNLIHYPDFDIPSPLFYKSLSFGIGIQYRLIKNKRFYNRL